MVDEQHDNNNEGSITTNIGKDRMVMKNNKKLQ